MMIIVVDVVSAHGVRAEVRPGFPGACPVNQAARNNEKFAVTEQKKKTPAVGNWRDNRYEM